MNNFIKGYLVPITIIIAVSIGLVIFPYDILHGLNFFGFQLETNKYHELGDFVGGITAPILSIVAIILLYMTYNTQKKELAESKSILTKQSQTLNKQQFETTLFNMVNLHHEIVNSIDLVKKSRSIKDTIKERTGEIIPKNTIRSRDCFKTFYDGFKNEYHKEVRKNNASISFNELINSSYKEFYKRHQSDLGHYFRNLYHIFKLIKRSEVEDKNDYASLVRAQLSSHELLMLFYSGLSVYGDKFKPLIQEFHILKNMPTEELIMPEHKDLYEESALKKI